MHLTQYRIETLRTLPDLGSEKLNLSHMAMGLAGELHELKIAISKRDTVNVEEELADWGWYASNLANMQEIDLVMQTDVSNFNWDHLVIATGQITEVVKRFVAYNKPIDKVLLQKHLQYGFNVLCNFYDGGAKANFPQAMERNIAKLKARFPEKFSDDLAINRNLENERNVLEGKGPAIKEGASDHNA